MTPVPVWLLLRAEALLRIPNLRIPGLLNPDLRIPNLRIPGLLIPFVVRYRTMNA